MSFRGRSRNLTADDVALILDCVAERTRLAREASSLSNARLAEKFDVSATTIQRIAKGTFPGALS